MFKYIYVIFLFCASVLTTQHVFIFTPRQIVAFVMFFVCLFEDKKLWLDKFFLLYLFFVFCYGISSLISGFFLEFILRFFGDYFVAYVALWSVKVLVVKYKAIDLLLYSFLLICAFDGLVSLCQFLGFSFLDSFLNSFHLISYQPYLDNYQGTGAAMLTKPTPGIFSHPALNAHILVSGTVLSTCFSKRIGSIPSIILTVFMVVCLFSAQQRTAFAIGVFSILVIVFILIRRTKYWYILLPFLGCIITFLGFEFYDFVANGNFRFSELGIDSTGRDSIYKECIVFIKNNPLGGINKFVEQVQMYPHNMVFNALIYGGWMGGSVLLFVVILQLIEIIKSLKRERTDITEIIFALAVFSQIINGLTHNQSIINGEIITWTIWGAYYYSKKVLFKSKINSIAYG